MFCSSKVGVTMVRVNSSLNNQGTLQENPTDALTTAKGGNKSTSTELKNSDPKTSEVSQTILASLALSTASNHLGEGHLKQTGSEEKQTGSEEKANDIAIPLLINQNNKEEINQNNKEEVFSHFQQKEAHTRQKIETQLSSEVNSTSESTVEELLGKLKNGENLTEKELSELLDNEKYLSDEEFDLLYLKIDEYEAQKLEERSKLEELIAKKEELLAKEEELLNEIAALATEEEALAAEEEIASIKEKIASAAEEAALAAEKISSVEDFSGMTQHIRDAVIFDNDGTIRAFNSQTDDIKQLKKQFGSFNEATGVLSLSKEMSKKYSEGQSITFKDKNGVTKQMQIKGIKILTEKEFEAFRKALIISQNNSNEQIEEESKEKSTHLLDPKIEGQPHRNTGASANLNQIKAGKIRSDTTSQSTIDKKLNEQEDLKRSWEKTIKEIDRNKRKTEARELLKEIIKKAYLNDLVKMEDYEHQDLKLDDQAKEILKNLEGYEIPLPIQVKCKRILTLYQEIGKIVPKSIQGKNQLVPAFMMETLKFKEEHLAVISDVVKVCGTTYNKSVGSDKNQ